MTLPHTPAEAFPPGEYLRDELEGRRWTVTEFASIIGRPVQAVPEILNATKSITPDTALSLSEALGTSAEVWLNLKTAYQLNQRRSTTSRRQFFRCRSPRCGPSTVIVQIHRENQGGASTTFTSGKSDPNLNTEDSWA